MAASPHAPAVRCRRTAPRWWPPCCFRRTTGVAARWSRCASPTCCHVGGGGRRGGGLRGRMAPVGTGTWWGARAEARQAAGDRSPPPPWTPPALVSTATATDGRNGRRCSYSRLSLNHRRLPFNPLAHPPCRRRAGRVCGPDSCVRRRGPQAAGLHGPHEGGGGGGRLRRGGRGGRGGHGPDSCRWVGGGWVGGTRWGRAGRAQVHRM